MRSLRFITLMITGVDSGGQPGPPQ